jgi:hypothetical protein
MITTFLTIASIKLASASNDGLFNSVDGGGLASGDPRIVIARIIRVFLSFLGIIFLLIVLKTGFIVMLSGGKDEKIIEAKKTFYRGLIGLIIIFLSYEIVQFVFKALVP